MAAEARSTVPFEMICEELEQAGLGRPPVEVIFRTSQGFQARTFAGLEMTAMPSYSVNMPWGFSLVCDENAEQSNCRAIFDANTYDPAGVRNFIDRYKNLLDEFSRNPDMKVGDLLAGSSLGSGHCALSASSR